MIFEFASQIVNDSVKKLRNIMVSDQTNGPYGSKELKLTICRLNSKRLEDYLEQKDNCNSALTLRYFLLWLELDELKKQKSNCHVFAGDEINLLPTNDACSTNLSGLFCHFFIFSNIFTGCLISY